MEHLRCEGKGNHRKLEREFDGRPRSGHIEQQNTSKFPDSPTATAEHGYGPSLTRAASEVLHPSRSLQEDEINEAGVQTGIDQKEQYGVTPAPSLLLGFEDDKGDGTQGAP